MLPQKLYMPNTRRHTIQGIQHGTLSRVEFVVVHINQGTTAGTFDWWAKGGAGDHEADGAQVQVSKDGAVYQTMPLNGKAWHAGDANDRSIGIEHEGMSGAAHPHVQLHASANRVAWIHHECGLGRPRLNKTVFPHSHGGAAWGGHECPGPWPWDLYVDLCMGGYMDHWGR
jgi:N-acetyl-anhydromuramyl-L-alanine amidase AmpD